MEGNPVHRNRSYQAVTRRSVAALLGSLVFIAGALPAPAPADATSPYIGVQFTSHGSPALASSDVAGLVPQSNFNVVPVNAQGQMTGVAGEPLRNSAGSPTPVTLSLLSDDGWSTSTSTTSPDGVLLNGEDKSTPGTGSPTATYTLSGVPDGNYTLIVYIENDTPFNNANINLGPTTYYVTDEAVTGGVPPFARASSTSPATRDVGNYVEFDNVATVGGTLTFSQTYDSGGNGTSAVNGFQLLSAVPEPASALGIGAACLLIRRRRNVF